MQRGRPRRRTARALAAVATLLLLSSCGGSDDNASGRGVELSFFVFNEPSGAYQEAAKRCTKQSGGRYAITFEYLPSDADSQREQLVRRLGAEDPSIDLIGMDVIWTAEFANAGWVRPWSGAQERQATEGVFDSVVDSASFENELYAAPFTSNTQLLWYREDRVEEAPTTWDEMLSAAKRIGEKGDIEVQANFYEGFTVWATAMIESAGATILSGPTEVALEEEPTVEALRVMSEYASSAAAPATVDTSTEDTARLAFEGGDSSFMLNYPFVYPSAKENAPEVFKNMGIAKYPAISEGQPSTPPLGGINLGISTYSEHPEEAFEAALCLREPANQMTAASLGGLPPVTESVYASKEVKKAYPGFSELIKRSIEDAAPRAQTPAYTDLSLAIQRALHPVGEQTSDPQAAYDRLRDFVERAVKREGLL